MDQNQTNTPAREPSVKQQVVDSLKKANNVLVTVSANPTVDQLATCIGLTLMMNKLDKHATAVFSGAIPSTIEFLQPEKTLEVNTDSLRDFIISLDKSKADKLRYKVEDDVVRIYITPYRTSINDADLEFTQGDFNVDVVIALGVDNRDHLDQAILEHGRILHDAVVIGVSCGNTQIEVGSINWYEPTASSLSEMIVSISEAFKSGLLDTQMSTAFLTGIVAETDRFSNDRTTPKVMTISAQLMAAGANQQLIANQLAIRQPEPEPEPEPEPIPEVPAEADEPGLLKIEQELPPEQPVAEPVPETTVMSVQNPPTTAVESGSGENGLSFSLHEEDHNVISVDEVEKSLGTSGMDVVNPGSDTKVDADPSQPPEIEIDEHGKMVDLVEQEEERASHRQKVIQPLSAPKAPQPKTNLSSYIFEAPANGGTLTANTVPEHEQPDVSYDPMAAGPNTNPMMSHDSTPAAPEPEHPTSEPPAPQPEPSSPAPAMPTYEEIATGPVPEKTLADLEAAVESPHVKVAADEARNAIDQAANSVVPNPADQVPEVKEDQNSPPTLPPPFMPPLPSTDSKGELNLPPPQS